MNVVQNEPVLTAITAFLAASIALAAAFGLDFTTEQTAAVLAWVAAAYGIFLLVRSKVTPTAKQGSNATPVAPSSVGEEGRLF